jgi:hypothetical protein
VKSPAIFFGKICRKMGTGPLLLQSQLSGAWTAYRRAASRYQPRSPRGGLPIASRAAARSRRALKGIVRDRRNVVVGVIILQGRRRSRSSGAAAGRNGKNPADRERSGAPRREGGRGRLRLSRPRP